MNTEIIEPKNIYVEIKRQGIRSSLAYDIIFCDFPELNFTAICKSNALIDAKKVYQERYGADTEIRIVLKLNSFTSESDMLNAIVDTDIVQELIGNVSNVIKYCDADCDTMYLHSLMGKLQARYSALISTQTDCSKIKYSEEVETEFKKMWFDKLYNMFDDNLYDDELMSYHFNQNTKIGIDWGEEKYRNNIAAFHYLPSLYTIAKDYVLKGKRYNDFDMVNSSKEDIIRYIDANTAGGKQCYAGLFYDRVGGYSLPRGYSYCPNKNCENNTGIEKYKEFRGEKYLIKNETRCVLKESINDYLNKHLEYGIFGSCETADCIHKCDVDDAIKELGKCKYRIEQSAKFRSIHAKGLLIERAISRYKIDDYVKTAMYRIIRSKNPNSGVLERPYKIALDAIITYIKKDFLSKNKHLIKLL